jgi:glycosyl transferase family 25
MSNQRVPIFYINLASRPDRRQYMEDHLRERGLTATRIDAVPAASLGPDDFNRIRRPWGMTLRPAELACSLSHQLVWRTIVDQNLPAALVLEDDAVLSRRKAEFLDALGPTLPDGIDILKVETGGWNVRLSVNKPVMIGSFEARRLLATHVGASGYILSRDMAECILKDRHSFDEPIDNYLFSRNSALLQRHGVYQLTPAIATQLVYVTHDDTAGQSDLEHLRSTAIERDLDAFKKHRDRERHKATLREMRYLWRELPGLMARGRSIPFADPETPVINPHVESHR